MSSGVYRPPHGLLLAAGSSVRMGSTNKLLISIDGMPMARRAALPLLGAVGRLVVVTGFEAGEVRAVLAGLDIDFVHNPNYRQGLGSSLAAGVRALPERCSGVVVALADMPFVAAETVRTLVDAARNAPGAVIAPRYDGARGHPVLWPPRLVAALGRSHGDVGGKDLLKRQEVVDVEVDDAGVLRDLDVAEDLL